MDENLHRFYGEWDPGELVGSYGNPNQPGQAICQHALGNIQSWRAVPRSGFVLFFVLDLVIMTATRQSFV